LTQARENEEWDKLLAELGAEVLEDKLQRLENVKHYYRKYPYDGYASRVGLEYVDLVMPDNPLGEIISKEAHDELLVGLTERERWVAERAEEGYKPMDMALMRGVTTSNADRWIKHSVKGKFVGKLAHL